MKNTLLIKVQQGFTLIELMIVVSIIGILAAIAIPAYKNYMLKAKLVEAIVYLDAQRNPILEAVANNGVFPENPPIVTGSLANSKYIKSVDYKSKGGNSANVVLTLKGTGSSAIDGKYLALFALVNTTSGIVSWTCGSTDSNSFTIVPDISMYPFLPASCQN